MAYERVEDLTFSPEECHRLVKLTRDLGFDTSVGHYYTTAPDRTIAVYRSVLGKIFPGEWRYAQVVSLQPGGTIPAHTDGDPHLTRRHIVIKTNPMVWVFHDGVFQQLSLGGVYRMDPVKPHGAVNWGNEPRMHLFVDTPGVIVS